MTSHASDRSSTVGPRVSVVITTRNEERYIETCLRSVVAQTYDNVEAIVVDNASTDDTKEIARRYTDLVVDKGPERSAQRNFGMLHIATGDFVMYIDADMILSPRLIECSVARMQTTNCVALYIKEIVLGDKFWGKVRRFERSFYDGTVIDAARIFRRDILKKVGGFDESLSGPEDWDIDKKVRALGQIGLLAASGSCEARIKPEGNLADLVLSGGVDPKAHDAVIYHNETDFAFRTYLEKKAYYTASLRRYVDRWGRTDPDVRKQLGPAYRYLLVYVENGRWRKLLFHPALTLGMFALRLLVGLMYVRSLLTRRRPTPSS